jgi:hypothetical protein
MFIVVLFATAKLRKQPVCPLMEKWIKKMWHICTMKYYSAIKRKKLMLFDGKLMKLEILTLKQNMPDLERQVLHVFSRMWTLETTQKP